MSSPVELESKLESKTSPATHGHRSAGVPMGLQAKLSPDLPLLVVALPEEAQYLDTSLAVLLTGVGKVNAALALAKALGCGPVPSRVVNLGTAGGLRPGLNGLHMVRTVLQHDVDTDTLLKLTGVAYGGPIELSTDDGDDGVVLASGDAFVADTTARGLLATRAEITDMEGYALAAVAADAGVPLTMVKHVSDEADERAARSWLESVAASARELAAWAAANVPGY
jgi:adenosylhomocysteine nucleosidase